MGPRPLTTEEFIKRARFRHGNEYDYSLTKYVRSTEKVKIVCMAHGVFNMRPNDHLTGRGCPQCGNERKGDYNRGEERTKRLKRLNLEID